MASYLDYLRATDRRDIGVRLALWVQFVRLRCRYGKAAPRPRHLLDVDPELIRFTYFPLLITTEDDISKENTHVHGGEWDRAPVAEQDWFSIGAFDRQDFDRRHRLRMDRYAFHELMDTFEGESDFFERWKQIVDRFPSATDTKYADPDYMRRYLDLYRDIEQSGYKQGRELGRVSPYPEFDEVGVYVGREGRIDCAGFGKHRVIIAQQLGLDTIPVRVNVRHPKWQARRTAIVEAAQPLEAAGEYRDHPDIQHLLRTIGVLPQSE